MELVDDKIVEAGRLESTIVPCPGARILQHAIAKRIPWIARELARIGIALVAGSPVARDVKLVFLPFCRSGDKARPVCPIAVQPPVIDGAPSIEVSVNGYLLCPRCPAPKSGAGAIGDDIGAHGYGVWLDRGLGRHGCVKFV